MDHRHLAQKFLMKAEDDRDDDGFLYTTGHATLATAHAVLALLDYLQQDDGEDEAGSDAYLKLYDDWEKACRRIRQLEEDLEGAYAALRAREEADAAEMKERKTKEHDHNWIEITNKKDLPNTRYTCNHCGVVILVDPDGKEIDRAL